jgi:cytochrome c553
MSAHDWHLVLLLTVATPTFAEQATVAQGQKIASQGTSQGVAACISCHGMQGEGNANFPRLAGTGQAYLQAQLDAFADGTRKNPIMQPFAQKLSPTERTALAMFYSKLKNPFSVLNNASATPDDIGAWLATRGRWTDQLPACTQCHGVGGSGVGTQFPSLFGLPAAYIVGQLQAWKNGSRPAGPLGLMPVIASKLSDKEINAVAAFYGRQTSTPSPSPAAMPVSHPNPDQTAQNKKKGHQP